MAANLGEIRRAAELGVSLVNQDSGTRPVDWTVVAGTIREICEAELVAIVACDPSAETLRARGWSRPLGAPETPEGAHLPEFLLSDELADTLRRYHSIVVTDLLNEAVELEATDVATVASGSRAIVPLLRNGLIRRPWQARSLMSFALEEPLCICPMLLAPDSYLFVTPYLVSFPRRTLHLFVCLLSR